jgi:hypothetical protein
MECSEGGAKVDVVVSAAGGYEGGTIANENVFRHFDKMYVSLSLHHSAFLFCFFFMTILLM